MPNVPSHGFGNSLPKHRRNEEVSTVRTGLYDHKWRQARAIFLRRNPLCAHCKADGRVTVANEVDHVIPHKGNLSLFWNRANWSALCKPCHSKKTAKENGGFGNKEK